MATSPEALRLANGYFELGNTAAREGRFEQAASCYRQALQLHPDRPESHANLGVALAEHAADRGKRDRSEVVTSVNDPRGPGVSHEQCGERVADARGR